MGFDSFSALGGRSPIRRRSAYATHVDEPVLIRDASTAPNDLLYLGCCLREDGVLHICCTKDWPSCNPADEK